MFSFLKDRWALLASLILLSQITVYYGIARTEKTPEVAPWSEFPVSVGRWTNIHEQVMSPEILERLRPDDYIDRVYSDGGQELVGLFIGYFKTQRTGHAPHSPQNCLPSAGWTPISSEVVALPAGGTNTSPVNEYVLQKDDDRLFAIYWLQQNGRTLTNEIVAQFYAIPDLLLHGRTDIALIRIIVPFNTGQLISARERARQFAAKTYPLVRRHMP